MILAVLAVTCTAGLACSVAFYIHTTRVVFNRRPTLSLSAFWRHLMMTRPLEVLWRFLTAPLRVLPDVEVLGEVRTGTTTLAAHLRSLGCLGPFSPWVVPLASDKESFYFVGHYWGMVHPGAYRMCFPLKLTMWLHERLLGHRPPVFDACASHLNAPWAAPLMRCAAPDAALVVLLRPPAEQNLSWWRLEMGVHAWARDMGMNEDFLPENYPPQSLRAAVALSRSPRIKQLYLEGEVAAVQVLAASSSGLVAALAAPRLPERLLPFPGGQLAAFAQMGRFADNIKRYADLYGLNRMVFLETAALARPGGTASAVRQIGELVPALRQFQDRAKCTDGSADGDLLWLNQSPPLPSELEPNQEVLAELRNSYREDNLRLYKLLGRDLKWDPS